MPRLNMFNSVSLDGYFTDADNDIGLAHAGGDEDADDFQKFVAGNAKGENALVFGRVTYQMMADFWPTPAAAAQMPEVAAGMNRAPKYVFSRSLKTADWAKTTVLNGDPAQEIAKLKRADGPGLTVLGSGRSLFDGMSNRPRLKLANHRSFTNGKVFLHYTA